MADVFPFVELIQRQVFLLAGHGKTTTSEYTRIREADLIYEETTAHTLCFALCMLAMHPEVQANAYAEVCRLWPEASSLDMPSVRVLLRKWKRY